MAYITLNELAALTKQNINTVRQHVKRKKIVKTDRGKIDKEHPTNKAYIEGRLNQKTKPKPEPKTKKTTPKPVSTKETKEANAIRKQIDRELKEATAEQELDAMGEQELKEQLLREKIISAEKEREYKIKQTMLSDTRRRKMEGDLVDTDWVISTLGHGIGMYKNEVKDAVDTLLNTIFSEQGINGEDKGRYSTKLIEALDTAHKEYEYRLTKQVSDYSPEKITEAT